MILADDRKAVLDEVRLIVREAVRDGNAVRVDGLARIVAWTYSNSGFSISEIADRIRQAAEAARVPIDNRGTERASVMPSIYSAVV